MRAFVAFLTVAGIALCLFAGLILFADSEMMETFEHEEVQVPVGAGRDCIDRGIHATPGVATDRTAIHDDVDVELRSPLDHYFQRRFLLMVRHFAGRGEVEIMFYGHREMNPKDKKRLVRPMLQRIAVNIASACGKSPANAFRR